VGVAWLTHKLAPWGECLEAGEVVLAGSFTRPVAARAGDVFDADYGALGRFEFKFF
jgi:2-oxo-hept-3-ene-1,7-dioate hydratase